MTGIGPGIGIVFDLDGTLVESAPAIRDVANAYMAELGLPPLDLAETRSYVGSGASRFLERALVARGAHEAELFEVRYQAFHALYGAAPPEANLPMPGSIAAMQALVQSGHRLALCTNKPMTPTGLIIDALGWRSLLQVVVAGDSLPERKPHPAPLQKAARDLGRTFTIYVGDSEVDAACAQAAGLPFVLYTGGYLNGPLPAEPAARFGDFAELPGIVAALISDLA